MNRILVAALVVIFTAILPTAQPARAEPIDRFVGDWQGRGITENGTPAESVGFVDRELEVSIKPTADGFNVTWLTRRSSASGSKVKHTSVSVPFVAVERRGMYRMAADTEPLSGTPYVWARIADHILEIHSITISDRGVLEYQKYIRTLLNDDEMQLRFTRSVDGSIVRSVLAHLTRK